LTDIHLGSKGLLFFFLCLCVCFIFCFLLLHLVGF
jgi:hypothetical protein